MKPQFIKNVNTNNKSVKKSAYIQYNLKVNGFSLSDIARDLCISPQAVWRVVSGLSTSKRVNEWIKLKIGIDLAKN